MSVRAVSRRRRNDDAANPQRVKTMTIQSREPVAPSTPGAESTSDIRDYTCPMHPDIRRSGPGTCPKCGMALEPVMPIATPGTEYVCPMHPQIVRNAPGACPICGMALEPRIPAAEEAPDRELADMTRRFWVGTAFTLPLLALFVSELLPSMPLQHLWPPRVLAWAQFAVAIPAVAWAGWPLFVRGWQSVVNRSLNMFTLIALGTGVAFAYSVVAVLVPDAFPAAFRAADGSVLLYFEAAAVITTLVLLGQVLELRARSQTSGAIRALLGLAPKTARRVAADGSETDVPLAVIVPGDTLRVRPGERCPSTVSCWKAAARSTSRW